MNKEYVYISDSEVIITDENGHTTKRSIDGEDIHNLLLLENKLEEVNNVISEAQNKMVTRKNFLLNKNKLRVILYSILLGVTVLLGVASSKILGTQALINCFGVGAISLLVSETVIKLQVKKDTKEVKGYQKELEDANKLKEYYEKRISSEKSLTKESKDNENNIINVGEVVSLDKENKNSFYKISNYLEESYDKGYNDKTKKLVLKKR